MVGPIHQSARLIELLAGEAADDLTEQERGEIEPLKTGLPATRQDDFMRVAALAQLAFLSADPWAARKMPAGLEARLMTRATAFNGNEHAGAGPGPVIGPWQTRGDVARMRMLARRTRFRRPGRAGSGRLVRRRGAGGGFRVRAACAPIWGI